MHKDHGWQQIVASAPDSAALHRGYGLFAAARSPDAAGGRNPGATKIKVGRQDLASAPDFAALHPGYSRYSRKRI